MKHRTVVVVTAEWDEDASVWVAISEDENIGLVTEAATLDELKDRVLAVLPELMRDNTHVLDDELGDLMQLCVQQQFRLNGSVAH